MGDFKLGRYQHYKGGLYDVLGVGKHSETLEELVVYRPLKPSDKLGLCSFWIRPKKMFLEEVSIDGKGLPRFKYVGGNID